MISTLSTVIAPYATPIDTLFFALVFIVLVSGILAISLFTKRVLVNNRNRGLLGMLSGFIALVSLCAVIFTWIYASSIQPIVFDNDKVTVGSDELAYNKIEKNYIRPLIQKSRYSAQLNIDTALVYVIEMRDGKSYLLSNDNYDLQEVKFTMDKFLK